MKKETAYKLCFGISMIFAVAFIIKCVADYFRYDPIVNSAPFYVWIIVNALYFLIPSVIILTAGIIIMKKHRKQISEREK